MDFLPYLYTIEGSVNGRKSQGETYRATEGICPNRETVLTQANRPSIQKNKPAFPLAHRREPMLFFSLQGVFVVRLVPRFLVGVGGFLGTEVCRLFPFPILSGALLLVSALAGRPSGAYVNASRSPKSDLFPNSELDHFLDGGGMLVSMKHLPSAQGHSVL